jgi:hypothetical protein
MSGANAEGFPEAGRKDPVVRFLAGCAIVAAVCAAVFVAAVLLVGWQLAKDETPERARESFLVGDETTYWCVDLKPDDAGLVNLFARFNEINDATRREILRGTFLEGIPFPRKHARLDDLAPFTLELALSGDASTREPDLPRHWAARGTLSRGMLRLRVALKLMRWAVSRKPGPGTAEILDVDGLKVTHVSDRDKHVEFAVATAGSRVIVTSDADRMRTALQPEGTAPTANLDHAVAVHRRLQHEGEDAWAFLANARVGDGPTRHAISSAVASFDLNDRDELVFRMIVDGGASAVEGDAFRGTRDECSTVIAAFVPGIPLDAIELDGGGARRLEDGNFELSGRLPGVSTRLAALATNVTGFRLREALHQRLERESPSATPTPPSPPKQPDPRNGTPAGTTHEENPTPRR